MHPPSPKPHAILALLLSWAGALCVQGAVTVTVFNSNPLLESDLLTPLQGVATSGDFLQILRVGDNGVPDPPNLYGDAGNDDLLLAVLSGSNPTHVGIGEAPPNWNQGFFTQVASVDNAFVGGDIFIRFWNATTPVEATHYGHSDVFTIPAPDAFGQSVVDVAPLPGSSRAATVAFEAIAQAIPEPSSLPLLGGLLLSLWMRRRRAMGV